MDNEKIYYIVNKYNFGKIKKIELLNSSQNKVYKVITDKDNYVVKEFNKDAINNNYYLKKRKEQINISEILNSNGIETSVPIKMNNKYFISYKKRYYLIYKYIKEKTILKDNLSIDHIKTLASTQAKIHLLNIKSNLRCVYKKININYNKYLKKYKNTNNELYNLIKNNINSLEELTINCNNGINLMKDNLCISHNDYKLLNILWKSNNEIILLDFDATGLANPSCCLCESAYTFSQNNNKINYEYYKEYLKTYIDILGPIKENFKNCLYVSMNGKLQWLSYILSKDNILDSITMIEELLLYYNNIDIINNIYLELISE